MLSAAVGGLVLNNEIYCTATRIAPGWALTAAHCVRDAWPSALRTDQGESMVVNATVHPTLDAALLELDDVGDASTTLPLTNKLPSTGDEVMLAGRGYTETAERGDLRTVIEHVSAARPAEITVDGQGKSGACHGDSGGPLLLRSLSGGFEVIGVLARGSAACTGLDAYVPIVALRAWLDDVLDQDC
jgi:secreted trypsin-like serine protease